MSKHVCLTCEHLKRSAADYRDGHPAYAGRCDYIIGAKLPAWAAPMIDRADEELVVWTDAPRTGCETWEAAEVQS